MNMTLGPPSPETGAAVLQDGELGFIEPEADGFRIVPYPWSALMGVQTSPYPSREAALQAACLSMDQRATGRAGPDHG